MLCVYKFNFSKSPFDLNDDYDRLSDIDKEKIAEIDAEAFIDFEENEKYAFFIITEPTEVKKYTDVLDENLVWYDIKNVSDEILKGSFKVEDYISEMTISFNSMKYSFFIDDLNDWIYNNLDIDTILDRISSFGIDSLTKVEKKFLENYNL
jgi:hypothetical protein